MPPNAATLKFLPDATISVSGNDTEIDFTGKAKMRKANQEDGSETYGVVTDHSLLHRFRDGEQDAATQLYLRYSSRLQSWATLQTSSAFVSRFDEEDVVQSVFRTLFRRVAEGLYDVPPGEELWQLLLVIALNKIRKLATFHRAQKRDVEKTSGSDVLETARFRKQSNDETSVQILQFVLDDLLSSLPEAHRTIVRLRMEGNKADEIAEQTQRSSRTVERVLKAFRCKLSGLLDVGCN